MMFLAAKIEGVGLIVRAISFQNFRPVLLIQQCYGYRQTERWTDGRHAIAIPRFAL